MVVYRFNYCPLLLIFMIFSYIIIRNYFAKNIKENHIDLNKRLSLIMMIAGIISTISLFMIKYTFLTGSMKTEYEGSLLMFLFSSDNVSKYEFRIIGIMLFIIAIIGMLLLYIKNKSKFSIFCLLIGILANIMIYIDFLRIEWSRIANRTLGLTVIGSIFLIIYLVIYILLNFRYKRKD